MNLYVKHIFTKIYSCPSKFRLCFIFALGGAKIRWGESRVQGGAKIKWAKIEWSENSREAKFEKNKVYIIYY